MAKTVNKTKPLPITKKTNLGELVITYPHLAQVLIEDYGLHCVGCFASAFDTLEIGAKIHGMDDTQVREMVKRLRKINKDYSQGQ